MVKGIENFAGAKLARILFALLVSTLFITSVCLASPPPDYTDADGEVESDVEPDADVDGEPEADGDGLLQEDHDAQDHNARTFSQDSENESGFLTTHLEDADIDSGGDVCSDIAGPDGQVQVRAADAGGNWPGYETYRVWAEVQDDGSIVCKTEKIRYDRVNSCFDGETKILMSDKSFKPIKEILAGDMVWNPALNKAQEVTHVLVGPEKIPMIEVGYGDTKVKITQTHPMVTLQDAAGLSNVALNDATAQKSKVVKASQLREGDSILGADGKFHKIEQLRELPVDPKQVVYNFEVKADSDEISQHMIVAEGFITGDVRVQANLNDYTLPWDKE